MAYTFQKSNYKVTNPYYYKNTDEQSLLPDELSVNTKLNPLKKEHEHLANLEIEKQEIAFLPTGELLKATGKTHAKGGTPVNLPENSFIFSNYKPLAIGKEDRELFKFKTGGKVKNNTPAKLLGKEIDLEHHNRVLAIQSSPDYDSISKKSSELMLQKNFKKAGQVAFLQEEKKGFPDGLPYFSEGTAPIPEDKSDIMEDQFMQLGGSVWPGDRYGDRRRGTPKSNATNYSQKQWDDFAKSLGYKGDKGVAGFQELLYNDPRFQPIIQGLHEKYKPGPNKGWKDSKLGYRWDAVFETGNPQGPNIPLAPTTGVPKFPISPRQPRDPFVMDAPGRNIGNPYISPGTEEDTLPYTPEVPLTPAQKLSLGYTAYNAASINKYAPKRMQTSFTPVTLERINAQPTVNAINNQTQQAYRANQVMNPYIARANNSQIYGRGISQISDSLGQINNQNSQISNQENLYNNQGINTAANQNVQLDNQYYNQVQTMNQNYDDEKRFATNRLADQYMGYKSTNDALKFQLASQPTFGSITVYEGPNGEISRTPKPNYRPRKQAAPLYDYNARKNSIYYTGAGLDFEQLPMQGGNNMLFNYLDKKIASGQELTGPETLAYERMTRALNPSRTR